MTTDDNEGAVSFDDEGNAALIDLGDTDENSGEFAPIPRGKYSAIVEELEYKISSAGNPMWAWKFEITDGEFVGRFVWNHTVFNAKSAPRLKKSLLAMGRTDLIQTPFDPQDEDIMQSLVGAEVTLELKITPAKGEYDASNAVKNVLLLQSGGEDFMS